MATDTGYVDDAGSEGKAHWQMLLKIKTLAEANGWTTLRYTNSSDLTEMRELILKGEGLSADQEIYIGFRSYQDVSANYYNLSTAGFIGYVPSNDFESQPGYIESGIPAHNSRIDYWVAVNAQRITFGLKVGTPVYETAYAGYFLPYASPGQWPYPLAIGGMLDGVPPTRYSDGAHSIPYKGDRANMRIRNTDGVWLQPSCHPWSEAAMAGSVVQLRDTGGIYPLVPVTLHSPDGVNKYGDLDGVSFVPGFGNSVEKTIDISGTTHVVIQDVSRTGFVDYYALRLS